MNIDWKDALASMRGTDGDETVQDIESVSETESVKTQKSPLHIAIEKKGRGGKTATIIYGFEINDEEISNLATRLKQSLGTGGSARGGEILLQGDCREKASGLLKSYGFKCK